MKKIIEIKKINKITKEISRKEEIKSRGKIINKLYKKKQKQLAINYKINYKQ